MKALPLPARTLTAVALIGLCATAQAQQPEALQILQMLSQRAGNGASMQPAMARASLQPISEAALGQQLGAWKAASGPFAVERFRDGFSIDGERILDPEGRIVQFAVDQGTGDAAYLVESMSGQFVVKLMRYRTGAPVTVASASRLMGSWSVETATGVRVNGSRLNLNPRGFIVARDNALFSYVPGSGLRSYGLPETHTLAAHQNGSVGATGWLLLEKRQDTKDREGGVLTQSGLGNLVGAVKGLGASLGVSKADSDYALYNIETRKMIPLGISLGDKDVGFVSQCHQKSRWIAKCDQLDTLDSLYAQDGGANRSHYFWRVSWFDTTRGPIAVVMEDGISKIDAIDLNTGRRAAVFQRGLGIGDWSTVQASDGRVQVRAKLGFESAMNDDVGALFNDAVAAK